MIMKGADFAGVELWKWKWSCESESAARREKLLNSMQTGLCQMISMENDFEYWNESDRYESDTCESESILLIWGKDGALIWSQTR